MKFWSLLIWVTQFGLSIIFPVCFFLLLGTWLQNTYGLGTWVMILCGVLGLLTSVSTVRSCIRSLRKDTERAANSEKPPLAFNDHE